MTEPNLDKMPHRDDLDPEDLEQIQDMFPGMKIVCLGDIPEDQWPEETREMYAEIEAMHQESLRNGTCIDCKAQMPNWPDQICLDDWEPASGWTWFENPDKSPAAWQCPECDAKDEQVQFEKL